MVSNSICIDITRSNWSNQNVFPYDGIAYIDTNSVINLSNKQQVGQDIDNFIKEFVGNHNGMITWSQATINELLDYYTVDEYILKARSEGIKPVGNLRPWKVLENNVTNQESSSLNEKALIRLDNIEGYLMMYGEKMADEPQSKIDKGVREIMRNYGGSRKDGEHFYMAYSSGINCIITQDTASENGFLRYPNLNIFGNSKVIKNNYDKSAELLTFKEIEVLEV